MAKQIDHDKLNEFFGLASEFGDYVERYRDHERMLADVTDPTRQTEIKKEMGMERKQIKKLFATVQEELPDVLPFHTADGGVIDEVEQKMRFVEENIFGQAA